MKKLISLVLAGVLAMSIVACGGGTDTTDVLARTVYDNVYNTISVDEKPGAMEIDAQMLLDVYGLDESQVADFVVSVPMMSAQIDETVIIKAQAGKVADVEAALVARQEYLKTSAFYPELVEFVENYKMTTIGDYVFFAVGHHADTYLNAFESQF